MEGFRRHGRERRWHATRVSGEMRFRPLDYQDVLLRVVLVLAFAAIEGWWPNMNLQSFGRRNQWFWSQQTDYTSSRLRHVWTCTVCLWHWLALCPQPTEIQLTSVLKTYSAMFGTDAPVKWFLHTSYIMIIGRLVCTPTWFFRISWFLNKFYFRIKHMVLSTM